MYWMNPFETLWYELRKLGHQKQPAIETNLIDVIIQSWFHVTIDVEP